ncbi:hypothetical protein J6590_027912 [Homalodisca vitripennis]|nr:hypothetical protein J6590_027912 [Homalodisca vitripennis]
MLPEPTRLWRKELDGRDRARQVVRGARRCQISTPAGSRRTGSFNFTPRHHKARPNTGIVSVSEGIPDRRWMWASVRRGARRGSVVISRISSTSRYRLIATMCLIVIGEPTDGRT